MSTSGNLCMDMPGMVLRLAGEAGRAALARSADAPGAGAAVDQHVSQLREALASGGRTLTVAALLGYAQGFAEAAIARGWWPQHGQRREAWQHEPALG